MNARRCTRTFPLLPIAAACCAACTLLSSDALAANGRSMWSANPVTMTTGDAIRLNRTFGYYTGTHGDQVVRIKVAFADPVPFDARRIGGATADMRLYCGGSTIDRVEFIDVRARDDHGVRFTGPITEAVDDLAAARLETLARSPQLLGQPCAKPLRLAGDLDAGNGQPDLVRMLVTTLRVSGIDLGPAGAVIRYDGGSTWQVAPMADQAGASNARIASDERTVGWLVARKPNAGGGDRLVVYRSNERVLTLDTERVLAWRFVDGARRVALLKGAPDAAGPREARLVNIDSGDTQATYEFGPANAAPVPVWAQALVR